MKAVRRWISFELECPLCGEGIPAPDNGSFLWHVDLPTFKTTTCPACKQRLVIPKEDV